MIINKNNNKELQKQTFVPKRKMGAFETGIYRSVRVVPHSRVSYLVKPIQI